MVSHCPLTRPAVPARTVIQPELMARARAVDADAAAVAAVVAKARC